MVLTHDLQGKTALCLTQLMLRAIRLLMSIVPNSIPGKAQISRALLSWLPNGGAAFVVPGAQGLRYEVPSLATPITVGIIAFGEYERGTISIILQHLKEDGLFVDIGANVGAITLPVAHARPRTKVLAIEASERIFAILKRNVHRNNVDNVELVRAFVGARDGHTIPFYEPPDRKFGMGSAGNHFHTKPHSAPQRALDQLLDELGLPTPQVIKLDIEGAEVMALRGMKETLTCKSSAPLLIFEFADWAEGGIHGQSPGDAQKYLMECGYELRDLDVGQKLIQKPLTTGATMILGKFNRKTWY